MLPYPGSKRKQLALIEKYLPDHMSADIFDPFGGAGCVSFWLAEKFPGSAIHFNDLRASLPALCETLQDEEKTNKLIEQLKTVEITCAADRKPWIEKAEQGDAFAMVVASASGFRGMIESTSPNIRNGKITQPDGREKPLRKVFQQLRKLHNLHTTAQDGLAIIEENKNRDCFIYCDPPYAGTRHLYAGFSPESVFRIAEIMRDDQTKAKICIQLDFTGGTYTEFKDLIKWVGPVRYTISQELDQFKRRYNDYQLIATNYETANAE